jgi:Flp pilus assembly protein TadG
MIRQEGIAMGWKLPGRSRDGRRSGGQSAVELAVVLPVVLTLALGGLDFARAYERQLRLEHAVRHATEMLAATATSREAAEASARSILCAQLERPADCAVSVTTPASAMCADVCLSVSFSRSDTALGATDDNPMGIASISVAARFRTLFPYPYLTSETGDVTLRAHSTYAVLQGR